MRMLCVCARHEPKGYLSINGNPLKVDAIARLAGVAETEAEILMSELELNGVFSRNRSGCIYSRRMVRDEKRSQEGRKNKKRGLREVAEKAKENRCPSRGPARGASPQKPEARSQIDGGGDGSARELTFLERVCAASGRPMGMITVGGQTYLPNEATCQLVQRWKDDLGLTEDQVVAEVDRQTRAKRDGPPHSLTYFTEGLRRLAGDLKTPPLTPAELPKGSTNDQKPASRNRAAAADDAFAERIAFAARNRSPSRSDFGFG